MKTDQNFANHKQKIPVFQYFLFGLSVAILIGSFVNLTECIIYKMPLYSASLICCLAICTLYALLYIRLYALKVQDRMIRAEENFRHYILTGKILDPRIGIRQVIALRFASDEEFPALASKVAAEGTNPVEIKKAIKNWRGDYNRV